MSTTDRCETKLTRLGGGLFDPTTRDKTAPATCVLEDTPIDRTYQPQCRLKKDPPPHTLTCSPILWGARTARVKMVLVKRQGGNLAQKESTRRVEIVPAVLNTFSPQKAADRL